MGTASRPTSLPSTSYSSSKHKNSPASSSAKSGRIGKKSPRCFTSLAVNQLSKSSAGYSSAVTASRRRQIQQRQQQQIHPDSDSDSDSQSQDASISGGESGSDGSQNNEEYDDNYDDDDDDDDDDDNDDDNDNNSEFEPEPEPGEHQEQETTNCKKIDCDHCNNNDHGGNIEGREILLCWDDDKWYNAIVVRYDSTKNEYKIVYLADDNIEIIKLDDYRWVLAPKRKNKFKQKNTGCSIKNNSNRNSYSNSNPLKGQYLEGSTIKFIYPDDNCFYLAMIYASSYENDQIKVAYINEFATDMLRGNPSGWDIVKHSPCIDYDYINSNGNGNSNSNSNSNNRNKCLFNSRHKNHRDSLQIVAASSNKYGKNGSKRGRKPRK